MTAETFEQLGGFDVDDAEKHRRRAELQAELDALNAEWQDVTDRRKAWMDAHMADFAKYPIGETMVDRDTGAVVGTVASYYRVHRDDPRYDNAMCIHYQIQDAIRPGCFMNTSSEPFRCLSEPEFRARVATLAKRWGVTK